MLLSQRITLPGARASGLDSGRRVRRDSTLGMKFGNGTPFPAAAPRRYLSAKALRPQTRVRASRCLRARPAGSAARPRRLQPLTGNLPSCLSAAPAYTPGPPCAAAQAACVWVGWGRSSCWPVPGACDSLALPVSGRNADNRGEIFSSLAGCGRSLGQPSNHFDSPAGIDRI